MRGIIVRAFGAGFAVAFSLGIASPALAQLNAMQQLGKDLFFDESLSHGGNQSCASCHSPTSGFADPRTGSPTSAGSDPTLFGNRNAPSAMYMAYSPTFHYDADEGLYIGGQFYDGRAATLEEQAAQPFLNPSEMGNVDIYDVISKVQSGAHANSFKAVFGANAFDDPNTAYANLTHAIAEFERTPELSPFSSKYDAVLNGKASLSAAESRGLEVFNDPMKGNCAACHLSDVAPDGTHPLFTDFTYDNIGIPKNYQSEFLSNPHNPDGNAFVDLGLGAIVGDPDLYGAFKVTTLRNLELTAPYGHNGYFASLDQIVDFYATRDVKPLCADPATTAADAMLQGCWPMSEMPDTVNHDELGNLPLTAGDKSDLIAFLRTLTDGYVSAVPEPSTWMLLIAGFGMMGASLRRVRRRAAAAN